GNLARADLPNEFGRSLEAEIVHVRDCKACHAKCSRALVRLTRRRRWAYEVAVGRARRCAALWMRDRSRVVSVRRGSGAGRQRRGGGGRSGLWGRLLPPSVLQAPVLSSRLVSAHGRM